MMRTHALAPAAALAFVMAAPGEEWVTFDEQTSERLLAASEVGSADAEEKDYAWGDVDADGDVDLVVARKQPFETTGGRTNVLLLNEGGALVDRTADLASQSDVPGDIGFRTATNDRDVALADVTGDGLLDVVTATTLSDGLPKHIGHPRIYVNLGHSEGEWLGFRHEDARIPQFIAEGGFPANPRFNAVAVGDLTGDGHADLYFGDGDISFELPGQDLDDRVLVNDGKGFFADVSGELMGTPMLESGVTTAVAIADVNGDGFRDVVTARALISPTQVAVAYNSASGFVGFEAISQLSSYSVSVAHLNDDSSLDAVVTGEAVDRVLVNLGNGVDGHANFHPLTFPMSGSGGNSVVADLDEDGHNDVIIADVDLDTPGCEDLLGFYRNLGGSPVAFAADAPGGLTDADRSGTFDVAVFDLSGDGWKDLVIGRCNGTKVWISDPPIFLVFTYPGGRPATLQANAPTTFTVEITAVEPATIVPGTAAQHVSIGGGPYSQTPLEPLGGDLYQVTLPAVECLEHVEFWLSAQAEGAGTIADPALASADPYEAVGAEASEIAYDDAVEGDVTTWTVIIDGPLTAGTWQARLPVGTFIDGVPAAPFEDASPDGYRAFVTGNGKPGAPASVDDLDGGPISLISPLFNLAGADGRITYSRWFFCDDEGTPQGDSFSAEISNDAGATWVPVPGHVTTGTHSAWESVSFIVGDVVLPTSQLIMRWVTSDLPDDSITEAGLDEILIEALSCGCSADIDGTGEVGFADLTTMLVDWGPCPAPPEACPADLDQSLDVGFADLTLLLLAWGDCP